jgi:probable phosphoglycerate mutase
MSAPEPVPQPALFVPEGPGTDVLLIRHGRSADLIPGSLESADPPLHDDGVAQAAALAARLADRQIDAVASSDLLRAVQTATPLAEARGLEIDQRESLREVHLGEWEGGEFRRRAAARDPEFIAAMESGRWESIPGAERDDDLRARVRATVHELAAAHEGGTVAIVCHGGVIQAFVADLLGCHTSFVSVIENTSVTFVRFGLSRPLILTLGDHAHLRDPLLT